MPLYEYQCQQCGHRFEKIQSFSAPEEKVCPSCGGAVERLISAPAIQFKGAGWYVNDYAGRSKAPSASSSDSKSGDSGSKEASASSGDGTSGAKSDSASGAGSSGAGGSAASSAGAAGKATT